MSEFQTSIPGAPYGKLPGDSSGPGGAAESIQIKYLRMARIFAGLVVVIIVVVAAGIVFLGTYQRPPSTAKVEVTIPNDRLSLQ